MRVGEATVEYKATVVPLAFSVSVTGHRNLATSDNWDRSVDLVAHILQQLDTICREHDRAVDLRLNSALAAGADQIAALAVSKVNESIEQPLKQWSLQAILPFERESYQATLLHGLSANQARNCFSQLLATADQLVELADRKAVLYDTTNPKADIVQYWQSTRYRTLGEMLVSQGDIVLAFWDSKVGGKGGTSDVVAMALQQGKPVLRIDPETLQVSWLMPDTGKTDAIALADQPHWGPSTNLSGLFRDNGPVSQLAHELLTLPHTDAPHGLPGQNSENKDLDRNDTGKQGPGIQGTELRDRNDQNSSIEDSNNQDDEDHEPAGMFSTAVAFFGSRIFTADPWASASQDSKLMEFRHPLLIWLAQYEWIRKILAGKSFPEQTRSTTAAVFYQWLVDFFTRNKPATTSESSHPSAPDNASITIQLSLKTDYALDDWILKARTDSDSSEHTGSEHNSQNTTYNLTDRPDALNGVDERLKTAMVSSDAIATARGHTYRSSYVVIFIGGALAVWIGLLGIFSHENKHLFVLTELLILGLLVALYLLAKTRNWHLRWLNARHLTESLRAGRYRTWIGFGGRRALHKDAPWGAWYTNAVMATPPLGHFTLDKENIRYIARELRSYVEHQSTYHEKNKAKLLKLHYNLEAAGARCLYATMAIASSFVIYKFFFYDQSHLTNWFGANVKYLVTVFCAGLTAFAGALMGIRFQGDFERFAERSRQTHEQLEMIDQRLVNLIERNPQLTDQPLFEELTQIIQDLADVFEKDLEDWRFVYSARPTPEAG